MRADPAIVRRLSLGALGVTALASLALSSGCHGLFLRPGIVGEAREESEHYLLRTDAPADARRTLLREAEAMRRELDILLPPPGRDDGERREVIAYSRLEDLRRFLRAHLFAQGEAVGFFCDAGGEAALVWSDPPGPENVRVLRHELVHQHIAARLRGRLPTWLEEGLAERIALGIEVDGPFGGTLITSAAQDPGAAATARDATREAAARLLVPAATPAAAGNGSWAAYRARRFHADAFFGALEVQSGRPSWPDGRSEAPVAVPPPTWAGGEKGGYVLHLLFIRFLEAQGEGKDGALGRMLARAAAGEDAELDLSGRFATLAAMEDAFHAYVLGQGLAALIAKSDEAPAEDAPAPAQTPARPR